MKTAAYAIAAILIAAASSSTFRHPAHAQPAASNLDAVARLHSPGAAQLLVSSQSWELGGDIPLMSTRYGGNFFPGLVWSPAAKDTESFVIIIQDIDESRDGEPLLQLTLYNIPADATRLNVGMVPEGNPRGSSYGPNDMGNARPYSGPHPPPGPKHHYHFQVFALNKVLPSNEAMTYDELLNGMRGHVLASGEIVGLSKAPGPITETKPAPPPDPFIK
jgi:para-nitrobenzyl esterase